MPRREYVWEMQIGGSASARVGFWGATPVVQPLGTDQRAVALGNADGGIGGLVVSDPPIQTEVQALRDKCEELADDVRVLSTLVTEDILGPGFEAQLGGHQGKGTTTGVARDGEAGVEGLGLGEPLNRARGAVD